MLLIAIGLLKLTLRLKWDIEYISNYNRNDVFCFELIAEIWFITFEMNSSC